jgi:hypothetical protein
MFGTMLMGNLSMLLVKRARSLFAVEGRNVH